MVKLKSLPTSPDAWLASVAALRSQEDLTLLNTAFALLSNKDDALLQQGLHIAEILLSLDLDSETLAAALIYPLFQSHEIHPDLIAEKFGDRVKKILNDALQMRSLEQFNHLTENQHNKIENLRKILLAMVTDIRAVIIILADQLIKLRAAKTLTSTEQKNLASKILKIYAPLANRLGIWQLKWEMEDLSLRYLEPDIYASIARSLANKRIERETYINNALAKLTELLHQHDIKQFKITGRVKHIYSIYTKMQRKGSTIEKIYDASAMRVLVPTIDDCYNVMSILHQAWEQIPSEFDDYINQPKENGYQSIHTVLIGPEEKIIEVQIRTYDMHDNSELGIASHWSYKENIKSTANYEEKIALLRQVMEWQKEISVETTEKDYLPVKDIFADRVYVFTPAGDIIDLPNGATPIDFAYAIHSEIGHRCRGAKINNKLVTLTYSLKTGDRVEIQTTKHAYPGRDWLNPHKGYIKTVRARNHIQHWFRTHEPIEKQLPLSQEEPKLVRPKLKNKILISDSISNNNLAPLSNYLTKFARCCKPLPDDHIIGYITQKSGLSVHRIDCNNFQYLKTKNAARVLEMNMEKKESTAFSVDLEISSEHNPRLLNLITTALANANIHIVAISENGALSSSSRIVFFLTIRILTTEDLNRCISLLNNIQDIIQVKRR